MFRKLTVRDCMVTTIVTFREETPIYEALDKILEYKFSGAPVVNEKKEILGMFSECDALRAILKLVYHEEQIEYQVKDFMTAPVDCVHEDTGLVDVASKFIKDGRRRLPVINDEDIVIGQLSRRDVLQAVRDFQTSAAVDKSS